MVKLVLLEQTEVEGRWKKAMVELVENVTKIHGTRCKRVVVLFFYVSFLFGAGLFDKRQNPDGITSISHVALLYSITTITVSNFKVSNKLKYSQLNN